MRYAQTNAHMWLCVAKIAENALSALAYECLCLMHEHCDVGVCGQIIAQGGEQICRMAAPGKYSYGKSAQMGTLLYITAYISSPFLTDFYSSLTFYVLSSRFYLLRLHYVKRFTICHTSYSYIMLAHTQMLRCVDCGTVWGLLGLAEFSFLAASELESEVNKP